MTTEPNSEQIARLTNPTDAIEGLIKWITTGHYTSRKYPLELGNSAKSELASLREQVERLKRQLNEQIRDKHRILQEYQADLEKARAERDTSQGAAKLLAEHAQSMVDARDEALRQLAQAREANAKLEKKLNGTKDVQFTCRFSDGTSKVITIRAFDEDGEEILTPLALGCISETKLRYELALMTARLALRGSTGGQGDGQTVQQDAALSSPSSEPGRGK